MMRYFLTLSYRGTQYCGWQVQPNGPSVQAVLEKTLSIVLGQPIAVTGCGRTDAGVHARQYVAHFDADGEMPSTILYSLNSLLPDDVAVYAMEAMQANAHARFDAYERSYEYHIGLHKDPFVTETAWHFPQHQLLSFEKMQAVANVFTRFESFAPFCKSHSGVDTFQCDLRTAYWSFDTERQHLVFHISANRFLRGMVRLMVGACLRVGLGKMTISDVESALESQQVLKKNLSVPPQGLFLVNIKYPYPVPEKLSAALLS